MKDPVGADSVDGLRAALAESEARRAALLDASLGAVLTIDGEGRIVEVNAAAERVFGFRAADAIGRPMAGLVIPPEMRASHERGLRRAVEGGPSEMLGRRLELVAQRADGTRFPVELVIARVEGSESPLFTGFVLDLTQARRSEGELRERDELAAFERDVGLTISSTPGLDEMLQRCAEHFVAHLGGAFARIWTLDEDEHVLRLRASAGMYTHLDGPHSRVPVGQFKIGLIAEEKRPHLTNAVVGDERVHDQEWARREGMVAFAGYPLLVEGHTVGVVAMFARQPLSETTLLAMQSVAHPIATGIARKRTEDELVRQTNELRRVNQRKNEFLATLGHELRNPIQVVHNCLELLRSGAAVGGELETVRRQMNHLTRLVDDILDMAIVVRGEVTLVRRELSLCGIVRDAADAMRTLVEQSGQELVLDLPEGDDLTVSADEVRLVQVVTNLIHNASKYSEAGKSVRLELHAEGPDAVVRVTDQGIGIDASFLPAVFEMFSQAEPRPDRRNGGLGLGLPLARHIVEQHGGSIEAASQGLGRGSTFTVRLPRVAAAPDRATDGDPVAPAAARARRVLIVDDNRDAAESLALLVKTLGAHEVEVAFDGLAALAAAERFRPDLVLLDIGLPELDGYQVAGRLRARAADLQPTLVALTGFGGESEEQRARDAGFDRHVVKPLRLDGLRELLDG